MIKDLEPYQEQMANLAKDFIIPIKEASDNGENFKPNGYDDFYKIFKGFMEICETVETIEMLLVLIETNPPRSKRISSDLYFKHVIASYFSEIYILKERLNTFATKISRMYAKSYPSIDIKNSFNSLYLNIKESLDGINNTRNSHVHSERHSDQDLIWLSSLKLVSDTDNTFKHSFNHQYKLLKRKWKQLISDNNTSMIKLLINYFNVIFKLISVDGKIILPSK